MLVITTSSHKGDKDRNLKSTHGCEPLNALAYYAPLLMKGAIGAGMRAFGP
jgi:hypothetical protein